MTSQQGRAATKPQHSCAYVMLANVSAETLTIPKATVLGVAEEVSESVVDKINAANETENCAPDRPRSRKRNELLYHKLL